MALVKRFSRAKKALSVAMLVFVLLSTLALAPLVAPEANAAASITLNPTSGPIGTIVFVTGSGFTPNGQVEVSDIV